MLSLTPAEVAGWRGHFQRHPPDAVDRLLSVLCRLQCADPKEGEDPITDATFRPWAYTGRQAAALRRKVSEVVSSRAQEERDRKLTAFMMG